MLEVVFTFFKRQSQSNEDGILVFTTKCCFKKNISNFVSSEVKTLKFKDFGSLFCIDLYKYDALRNSVPFIQLKNREKHPWRGVTFSKIAS